METNRFRSVSVAIRGVQVLLGLVFCITGWAHLQNEMMFYADLIQYGLVPDFVAPFVTILLPWMHFVIGAAMLANRFSIGSAAIGTILLLAFTAAQGYVYFSGKVVDCGCLGVLHQDKVGIATLVRTMVLFFMGLSVWWWYGQSRSTMTANSDV